MDGFEYTISRLQEDDSLEDIVRLEAASFSSPWSREMLGRELRNPEVARVYVLHNPDGALLAFCACRFLVDELHINTLAVQPDSRRRGLATALLRHALAEASAAGITRATLEVRRSNDAALRLYERLGFRVQAIRTGYYSHPVEDALILWSHELDVFAPDPQP